MIIVIDRGNTLTKATLFATGKESVVRTATITDLRDTAAVVRRLREETGAHEALCGICCSVGADDGEPMRSLMAGTEGDWMEFTHDTPLPIEIGYSTPSTLGLDRIAAASGAVSLYPGESIMIADAGTALTLDFADGKTRQGKKPVFIGGNISPGARLRAISLHKATGRLPEVEISEVLPSHIFGNDTRTAIQYGVWSGIVAETELAYRMAESKYRTDRLLLTGGNAADMSAYAGKLSQLSGVPCRTASAEIIENLVALGLKSIYEYNRHP